MAEGRICHLWMVVAITPLCRVSPFDSGPGHELGGSVLYSFFPLRPSYSSLKSTSRDSTIVRYFSVLEFRRLFPPNATVVAPTTVQNQPTWLLSHISSQALQKRPDCVVERICELLTALLNHLRRRSCSTRGRVLLRPIIFIFIHPGPCFPRTASLVE